MSPSGCSEFLVGRWRTTRAPVGKENSTRRCRRVLSASDGDWRVLYLVDDEQAARIVRAISTAATLTARDCRLFENWLSGIGQTSRSAPGRGGSIHPAEPSIR